MKRRGGNQGMHPRERKDESAGKQAALHSCDKEAVGRHR